MFDIKIGTLIPASKALTMIPQLNEKGFECYELNFYSDVVNLDLKEYYKKLEEVLDGRTVSAVGCYGNTLTDPSVNAAVTFLIEHLPELHCGVIGLFAGSDPEKGVKDTIPLFCDVFGKLLEKAEYNGVKIGLESCGGGWWKCGGNIAFCPDAWDLIFDAVKSENLGLEWEPSHALGALMDPIEQLRRYAPKVVHLHGKDATVAWDVIRQYGIGGSRNYCYDRTPGFGDTNWADIFTVLLQAGFEGACDIEGYHDPVHYDDMEWTAQLTALDYLKRCRGGLTYWRGPEEYRGYQGTRKKAKVK